MGGIKGDAFVDQGDDLDRLIAERTICNPEFPRLLEAAAARRELISDLSARRRALHIPQREVAEWLETNQGAVARLENGERDPKLSTLIRYAAAVRIRIEAMPIPSEG
ncbi:MAG: helix-turn-helix domain-containing protein [Candidatus Dormibacteraceae bacterium]